MISLSFPYFSKSISLACAYPSSVKGNPSMLVRIFGSKSSFRYANLVTLLTFWFSITARNWFQNLRQSLNEPLNFVIDNFGNFAALMSFGGCSFCCSGCASSNICGYLSFCCNNFSSCSIWQSLSCCLCVRCKSIGRVRIQVALSSYQLFRWLQPRWLSLGCGL